MSPRISGSAFTACVQPLLRHVKRLDASQVVADGSCHSIEGIKLEELALKTGEAKLLVRGNLLGAAQDASIILTDFPVAILQPMFRALPALEHAAPAVAASGECWSRLYCRHLGTCRLSSGGRARGAALQGCVCVYFCR